MRDFVHIDQIEAFLYVVELKSVHKASQALYLSQPTITARIKTLERHLNTELFTRNNRQLLLNDRGKAFIPYAQEMMQMYKRAKREMEKPNEHEKILIGANIITSQYFMPFVLPEWTTTQPNFKIQFQATTNDRLLEKVKTEEIDFAIMGATTDETVTQIPLLDNSIKLIVHPKHHFAQLTTVSVDLLAKEQLVFFECGSFDWNYIYKLFELEQVKPNIYVKTDHLEVAKSYIKVNKCIGFLPRLAVHQELLRGELMEIETSNLLTIQQHIYLTYRDSHLLNLLKDTIIASAESFMQQCLDITN
jgi:LysR family transcriptional regulator, low CO2-responsive transcriptional regulator